MSFSLRPGMQHPGSDGFKRLNQIVDQPSGVVSVGYSHPPQGIVSELFADFGAMPPNQPVAYSVPVQVESSRPSSSFSGCSVLIGIAVIFLIIMLIKFITSDCSKNDDDSKSPSAMIASNTKSNIIEIDVKDEEKMKEQLKDYFTTPEKHPKLLFIHADWCGHCKKAHPQFKEAAKAHPHSLFYMLNGGDGSVTAAHLEAHGCPAIQYFPCLYGTLVDGKGVPTFKEMKNGISAASIDEFLKSFKNGATRAMKSRSEKLEPVAPQQRTDDFNTFF